MSVDICRIGDPDSHWWYKSKLASQKLRQNGVRYKDGIDRLLELIHPTQRYHRRSPRGTASPKIGVIKKINTSAKP